MKWVREDRNSVTIIRRTLDGYTLELTTKTGRNRRGPSLIDTILAEQLTGQDSGCVHCWEDEWSEGDDRWHYSWWCEYPGRVPWKRRKPNCRGCPLFTPRQNRFGFRRVS